VIGVSLSAQEQDQLLLLSAYRNRVFRCPPPVRVEPGKVRTAFESLERLMEGLVQAAG
jgi:acetylornithine/succinyldiaminopimelate/putrescine aminotransferase